MKFSPATSLILLFGICQIQGPARGDDWRQWRGEHRDGTWYESGIVGQFTADSLPTLWKQEIGPGYSGPTVADGRVFVMDRLSRPDQMERILCFDAVDGKPLWDYSWDAPYVQVGYVAGPRASVTIAGNRAWALGTMGHLHCLDVADGTVIWQRDLNRDYQLVEKQRMPIWGIAASPLVYGDLVILHIGGFDGACIVALDKATGEERWRALDERAQYSSPVITQQNGQDILVCWTGDSISGLDPGKGTVLWSYPYTPKRMPIGIATPVVHDHHIFVTSFYDGSIMLRMAPDRFAIEKVWSAVGPNEKATEALQSLISTPVWIGDYIYGADSFGQLRCLRASDGQRIWEDESAVPPARWSTIHFVQNRDTTWMFNERGELILGRLTPSGFAEISRAKIIEPTREQLRQRDGVCWSHPAYANRCVFVRNDREIICISLAGQD